jgi:excisionase family DNA binding protein
MLLNTRRSGVPEEIRVNKSGVFFMQEDGAFTISDFCAWASIGRTLAYELIKRGQLRAIKLGGKTLIPKSDARAWLASLPALKPRASSKEAA